MNNEKEILNKYKSYVIELRKHNDLYYNHDSPKISDADYDALKKKIVNLENKYEIIRKKFNLIIHQSSSWSNKFSTRKMLYWKRYCIF